MPGAVFPMGIDRRLVSTAIMPRGLRNKAPQLLPGGAAAWGCRPRPLKLTLRSLKPRALSRSSRDLAQALFH